jgi:hypothetical protein
LQVGGAENGLLAIRLQSSMTLFSAAGASNLRCLAVLKSKDAMRVSFFVVERSCPEQRPRAALKPQARAPLERALGPGRPRRGPRESWSRSRGVVASSDKLQELPL